MPRLSSEEANPADARHGCMDAALGEALDKVGVIREVA
jgi:hypothetical protein